MNSNAPRATSFDARLNGNLKNKQKFGNTLQPHHHYHPGAHHHHHHGVEQFASRVTVSAPMHVHIPGMKKIPDIERISEERESRLSSTNKRQHSKCKRHTVDFKSKPIPKPSEQLGDTEVKLYDRKKKVHILQRDKLSEISNHLSLAQTQAFWNAFLLFDHAGTNTISANELSITLDHVGLKTNDKDIEAIIDEHDENGNGVLDFEEYLNLMTNPNVFIAMMNARTHGTHGTHSTHMNAHGHSAHAHGRPSTFHTPNKPDYRDCLMYEVMNEFFNSKFLGEEEEHQIVGFYAKTLKHVSHGRPHQQHAAHVVHHYADGARSLGLTEKEIKQEIAKIKEKQKHETNAKKRNSPYAKPMQMIPRIPKSIEYKKKYDVMSRNNIKEGHLIWRGTPIVNYHVKLPRISVDVEKSFENLKKIRKKAVKENNNYRVGLSEVQKVNSGKLWSMLRYKHIPCTRLKEVIKEVYGAYTTHVRMQPLEDKPKYVAYSVHDFKTVFPDLTDSEDSDDDLTDPETWRAHQKLGYKHTIRVKK